MFEMRFLMLAEGSALEFLLLFFWNHFVAGADCARVMWLVGLWLV
jgi:hypothetical protein